MKSIVMTFEINNGDSKATVKYDSATQALDINGKVYPGTLQRILMCRDSFKDMFPRTKESDDTIN